jgi:hypothetical protein
MTNEELMELGRYLTEHHFIRDALERTTLNYGGNNEVSGKITRIEIPSGDLGTVFLDNEPFSLHGVRRARVTLKNGHVRVFRERSLQSAQSDLASPHGSKTRDARAYWKCRSRTRRQDL